MCCAASVSAAIGGIRVLYYKMMKASDNQPLFNQAVPNGVVFLPVLLCGYIIITVKLGILF